MKAPREPAAGDQQLLGTKEVAYLLGVCARTAVKRMADGTVPAFRIGKLWRARRGRARGRAGTLTTGDRGARSGERPVQNGSSVQFPYIIPRSSSTQPKRPVFSYGSTGQNQYFDQNGDLSWTLRSRAQEFYLMPNQPARP